MPIKTPKPYKHTKNIANELDYPPILSTKTPKIQNELCFYGRKLKRELCRNTSKQTLRNTFSRGPPNNAYINSKNLDNQLGYYPLLSTKTPKIQNELCFYGRKLKRELCRNTSKQTLRNTFSRGPPNNAYINSKNLDNQLGYYPLLSTRTPKIDTQEYVYQGCPPIKPI